MSTKTAVSSTVTHAADQPPSRTRVILALLAVYIIWGSTYLAMHIAITSFPPFLMTSFRFLVAGGLLSGGLVLSGHALPTVAQARNAMMIGVLMLGVGTGGVAFAEQWVASGLAALAVAVVPIWTALFAGLWGRFPSGIEWIGLGVGLVGVVLLNLDNGMSANPLGAFALLLATLSWSFGSMWSRQLNLPHGLMAPAFQMLGGGIVLLMVAIFSGESFPTAIELDALLALGYLITFGSLIAYSAYDYLLHHVRPAVSTSYAYVNPVVAVILGVAFANETITPFGIAAMCIILAGVGILAFQREKKSITQSPEA